MNKLAQRLHTRFSSLVILVCFRPRAILLEPDTDLERHLFCRDLRSSGPLVR
jgi:hypothetical protein